MGAFVDDVRPITDADPIRVWGRKINTAWQKSTEGIFDTGRLLIDAEAALDHYDFERMVNRVCSFSRNTAYRLMKIKRDPVIGDFAHVQIMPPSWGTLYELCKLTPKQAQSAITRHHIDPGMTREDAVKLVASMKRLRRPAVEEIPESTRRRGTLQELGKRLGKEGRARLDSLPDEEWEQVINQMVDVATEATMTTTRNVGLHVA